jgi:hypothetical protein
VSIDHPELKHFQNMWSIHALIQQFLKNSSDQARESDLRPAERNGTEPTLVKHKVKKVVIADAISHAKGKENRSKNDKNSKKALHHANKKKRVQRVSQLRSLRRRRQSA